MNMSCQRSPPASPRAPKIQQESWDDCGTPPIDIFDPCQNSPPRSPSIAGRGYQGQMPKSPKSPRKFNKNIDITYHSYDSNDSPSISSNAFSFSSATTSSHHVRSPKFDNPPRSPKITTTTYPNDIVGDDGDVNVNMNSGNRSPKATASSSSSTTGGTAYYYDSTSIQSPRRSPKSPRKFVFEAISPSYEQKGKTFEYYEPLTPDEDENEISKRSGKLIEGYHNQNQQQQHLPKQLHRHSSYHYHSHHGQHHHQQQQQQQQQQQPQHFQHHHHSVQSLTGSGNIAQYSSYQQEPHKHRGSQHFTSRNSPPEIIPPTVMSPSPGRTVKSTKEIQQHHDEMGTIMTGCNIFNNGSNNAAHSDYQHHLDEFPNRSRANLFVKRDSCMTESTQLSGDSCDTNTTSFTTTTTLISSSTEENVSNNKSPSFCVGIINNATNGNGSAGKKTITDNDRISNSTIARGNNKENDNEIKQSNLIGGNSSKNSISGNVTGRCDMRGRRHAINITSNPGYQQILHSSHSTLDRTCSDSIVSLRCRKSTSDLTDVGADNGIPITSKPRRRGSSKGGLAYLASRRSSRESLKSACSNASLFSNEDIGPLAFQSSTRGRQRRTSNFLELPVPDHIRPRVCSLPDRPYNPRVSDDLYRLRHFSISKGTVVNCGDSIISRRSRSNTSVNSTTSRASERSPFDGSCCGGGYANVDSMPPSPTDSEPPPPPRYRIVMLGDAGVGKTALVSQFMTSEYMHTYDASLDDEFGEKTVSVLLDDEESELVFIDHPSVEMSVENSLSTYEPHACILVFSVVDRNSFRIAEEILNYLWKENVTKEKAVILVGNKADLARARVITTAEGKSLAASREAKFIETSSGIQHNVDELLVGILKQIRLKERRDKKAAVSSKMKTSRTHISLHLAKEILQKICLSDISKSKSCENLHVL